MTNPGENIEFFFPRPLTSLLFSVETGKIICLGQLAHIYTQGLYNTDSGIQNSRLFPDFFQNNNFFFQTHGYQIGDQKRTLKKWGNKTFSMMRWKCTSKTE